MFNVMVTLLLFQCGNSDDYFNKITRVITLLFSPWEAAPSLLSIPLLLLLPPTSTDPLNIRNIVFNNIYVHVHRLTEVTLYYSFQVNVKCCSMNTNVTQRGGSQCVIYGVESARLGEFRKPEVRCDTLLAAQLEHFMLYNTIEHVVRHCP